MSSPPPLTTSVYDDSGGGGGEEVEAWNCTNLAAENGSCPGDHAALIPDGLYHSELLGTDLAMPEWAALATVVLLSGIITFTIVGNVLVIISVFTHTPLKITPNFFIVSLAASDITVCVCVLPLNVINHVLGRWVFGSFVCKTWLTFDVLCCTASILNLCAIALDRYQAVNDPIAHAQSRSVKNVLLKIFYVWFFSCLICMPPLVGWNNWPEVWSDGTPCELSSELGYIIYSSSGSFFVPMGIIIFVYLSIFHSTRKRLRTKAKNQSILAGKRKSRSANPGGGHGTAPSSHASCVGGRITEEIELVNGRDNTATKLQASNGKRTPDDVASTKAPVPVESAVEIVTCESQPTTSLVVPVTTTKTTSAEGSSSRRHILAKVKRQHRKMYQKSCKNGSSSHLSEEASTASAMACNNDESAVDRLISEKAKISMAKERKAARTMSIIVATFIICWLPFFLMYVIMPFCGERCHIGPHVAQFITWLGYVNSTLNPIIYTVFNLDFRVAFKRIITCSISRPRR